MMGRGPFRDSHQIEENGRKEIKLKTKAELCRPKLKGEIQQVTKYIYRVIVFRITSHFADGPLGKKL